MLRVELSEETMKKLRAFTKIMEVILGPEDMPETDAERTALVVSIGLERMLQDVLPKEEMLLRTMTQMFNRNPEFVCEFISDTIRQGEKMEKEQADEVRKHWRLYT
jgi:F0F1-type ATP synthase alpha subunit